MNLCLGNYSYGKGVVLFVNRGAHYRYDVSINITVPSVCVLIIGRYEDSRCSGCRCWSLSRIFVNEVPCSLTCYRIQRSYRAVTL